MSTTSTTAAQLKEEGNRLWAAQDFRAAHDKYSQAIEVDPTNAALFSNRAACSNLLGKYKDAVADARKVGMSVATSGLVCAQGCYW